MFNWLKAKEEIDTKYSTPYIPPPPPVVIPPVLVIGEPVISLIAAMQDVHQWEFRINMQGRWLARDYYLKHIENKLEIKFSDEVNYSESATDFLIVSKVNWATKDEKEALAAAFVQFKAEWFKVQQEYVEMELAVERNKFMIFVAKS